MTTTIKDEAWTRLTRSQAYQLGRAIFRHASENGTSAFKLAKKAKVSGDLPYRLFGWKQKQYSTFDLDSLVLELGKESLSDAIQYGATAPEECGPRKVARYKRKRSAKGFRKATKMKPVAGKTPSIATFADQMNSLNEVNQKRVRKIVQLLWEQQKTVNIADEIASILAA